MIGQQPDTPELAAAMKAAYAGVLRNGAQLLAVWRSNLSDADAKVLGEYEDNGLTLGMKIIALKGSLSVQVIMTDAQGGSRPLCTLSAT